MINCCAGYKAYRRPASGTCFIRTLVYVFNCYSDKLHLIDMLTKVCIVICFRSLITTPLYRAQC